MEQAHIWVPCTHEKRFLAPSFGLAKLPVTVTMGEGNLWMQGLYVSPSLSVKILLNLELLWQPGASMFHTCSQNRCLWGLLPAQRARLLLVSHDVTVSSSPSESTLPILSFFKFKVSLNQKVALPLSELQSNRNNQTTGKKKS